MNAIDEWALLHLLGSPEPQNHGNLAQEWRCQGHGFASELGVTGAVVQLRTEKMYVYELAGAAYVFGPLDDDDHDGIVNLLEMAFGLNPTLPDGGTLVPAVAEDGFLTMTITKQPGVIYEVQSAGTLLPALPDSFSASTTTVLVDDATILKVRDSSPMAESASRFMRVQVNGVP